ncbi:hypothetical protein CPB85DRAFT_1446167 [Mucidula mucida]|nr:hypothetical protein CPB85DRAFT_1446167 [Mucidula mucida]
MSAIFKIDSLQLRRVGTFHGSTVHNSAPSSVDGLAGQAWIPGEKACFLRMRKSPSLEHVDIPPIGKHSAYGSTALPLPPPFHVPQDISLPWRRSLEASAVLAGPAFGPAGKDIITLNTYSVRNGLNGPMVLRACHRLENMSSLRHTSIVASPSLNEYPYVVVSPRSRLTACPLPESNESPYGDTLARNLQVLVALPPLLSKRLLSMHSLSTGQLTSAIGDSTTDTDPRPRAQALAAKSLTADGDLYLTALGFTPAFGRPGDKSVLVRYCHLFVYSALQPITLHLRAPHYGGNMHQIFEKFESSRDHALLMAIFIWRAYGSGRCGTQLGQASDITFVVANSDDSDAVVASSPRRCTPQFNLDSLLFDAVSHWPSWLPSTSHIPSRARSRSIREYTHAATLRLAWSPSNSKTDIPYAASRRIHLTVDIDFDLMECMLSNASVTDLSSGLIFSVISGIVGTGATSSSPPSPLPIFSSEHSAADRDADLTEHGFTHALGRLGDVSLSSPNSG